MTGLHFTEANTLLRRRAKHSTNPCRQGGIRNTLSLFRRECIRNTDRRPGTTDPLKRECMRNRLSPFRLDRTRNTIRRPGMTGPVREDRTRDTIRRPDTTDPLKRDGMRNMNNPFRRERIRNTDSLLNRGCIRKGGSRRTNGPPHRDKRTVRVGSPV